MAAQAFERRSRGSFILRILNAPAVNRHWQPLRCTAMARRLFPPSLCPIPKRLARVTIDRWPTACVSRPTMGRSSARALRNTLRQLWRIPRAGLPSSTWPRKFRSPPIRPRTTSRTTRLSKRQRSPVRPSLSALRAVPSRRPTLDRQRLMPCRWLRTAFRTTCW